MASYSVRFYKGDYPSRQQAANFDRAICYVEQHFNSSGGVDANYVLATRATNAPEVTEEWGRWYTAEVSRHFNLPDQGVSNGGYLGRANDHLRHTDMPALLLEPCFISNLAGAEIATGSPDVLAQILLESIVRFFPRGGLVAFSVGHKFTPNPNEHGAHTPDGRTEADLAEQVLVKAQALLEAWSSDEPDAEASAVGETPEATPVPVSIDFVLPAHITRKMEIERKLEAESETRTAPASTEAASIRDIAVAARLWVIDEGISDGTRPQDPVTREDVWLMLYRALKK